MPTQIETKAKRPGTSDSDPKKSFFWDLKWLVPAVCGLWVLCLIAVVFGPWKVECAGVFGDSFGALNTLFSGLAFACFIYTVFLQKEELALQRQEMALQRQEMADSRREMQGQKEQLQNQTRLMVLSARLSILPRLIDQQISAAVKANPSLKAWSEHAPTAAEADELAENFEKKSKELDEQIAGLRASILRASGQNAQANLKQQENQCATDREQKQTAAPRLRAAAVLLRDSERIYEELRDKKTES